MRSRFRINNSIVRKRKFRLAYALHTSLEHDRLQNLTLGSTATKPHRQLLFGLLPKHNFLTHRNPLLSSGIGV